MTKSQPKEMLPIVDKSTLLYIIEEAIYAYNFEGRRYDVNDKLGFLEATIDFNLKRPELRNDLMEFIKSKVEVDK